MAPKRYDEDAPVLDTVSDIETDSASDSDTLVHTPSAKDQNVLDEQEEVEHLLSTMPLQSRHGKGSAGRTDAATGRTGKRGEQKGRMRRRKMSVNEEASNLMYEMEEGFKDTSSNSSFESLLLNNAKFKNPSGTRSSYARWILTSVFIAASVALLVYGAYRASQPSIPNLYSPKAYSNGTDLFNATTILISLDGFRADFLQRGLTPSLSAFIASGVSPKYMLPSFPSVTFPNHYTLVTGLYPESHGIVSNQFWDPELQEEFYYTNVETSMQPKWWDAAEPLWVTAEKKGIRTAVHMWPGSEAHVHHIEPTYLDTFNDKEQLPRKVDRILEWLDMTAEERPQLIAAYVPDVDRDGHKYGPNSTEIRATIASADNMLTLLMEGLLQRNLTEIVNVVVVSDHGMATMSAHRMVQLDDIIDMSLVDHIDGWPLRGLRLKDPERDVPIMYQQLLEAARKHGTFDVYTLETMPQRYHFTNNPRIAPLWVVPKTGWLVIEREDFDIAKAIAAGEEFHPRGIHGFDHEHPLMRAIFVARGPAFPHAPNSRVPVFQNIEVYNIICDSLGITPHNNNGTTRLPLKVEGLHSDFDEPLQLPNDDPADIHGADGEESHVSTDLIHPAEADHEETNSSSEADAEPETAEQAQSNWWKYIHEQLEKAKDWAKQIMSSVKNNKEETDTSTAS